jgi:hypothetical protein
LLDLPEDGFPTFKIDLDLDPKERFKAPALYFKSELHELEKLYMDQMPEFMKIMFYYMQDLIYY